MATKYIITREDTHFRTQYLHRVRPTKWTPDAAYALRMDEKQARRESEWLNFLGCNHTVKQMEFE